MTNRPKDKSKATQYKAWKRYLADSRLTVEQQIKRAKEFTRKGMKVPE